MEEMEEPAFAAEPSPPAQSPRRSRRALLLLGCIATAGLTTLLVLIGGLVMLFNLPALPADLRVGETAPELAPPPDAPAVDEAALLPSPLVIDEDFEQADTLRWDQSSAQVRDGAYELRIEMPNNENYGLFLGGSQVRNFDMAVDTRQVAGSLTAEYGIRFRQSGPGTYLMFSISSSGYYRLVRVTEQSYQSLVPWTAEPRIRQGLDATNRLRVVADDATITAYINDRQVLEATDEVNEGGQLTFGLVTFDAGGLAVQFDNISGQTDGIDLAEDFSDPERVPWSIGGARIANGSYEIFAGGGIQSWQHPLPSGVSEVGSFTVEVDATLLDAGEGSAYGIIFGDSGAFDFYSLLLLPDGSLTMLYNAGNGESIALLSPIPIPSIEPGTNATNTIGLEVNQNQLTITINGEALPPLESREPIESGMVGMIVSSGSQGRVQVRFDNFLLQERLDGDEA